ncbi:MAG: hypothetical protein M3P48_05775 [Actinomycetota bacterium]|nr:hypothetical protein [Actinomycetota bacterium]
MPAVRRALDESPVGGLSRDDVLRRTYARVVSAPAVPVAGRRYARPLAPDIREVLTVETAAGVVTLTDDEVARFGLAELRCAGLEKPRRRTVRRARDL